MKQEDDLFVRGSLTAQWEQVSSLPATARAGRQVFLTTDSTLYYGTGTKWVPIKSGGGSGSWYYIGPDKVVSVEDGAVMNLLENLTLEGTILLDGMIADSVA